MYLVWGRKTLLLARDVASRWTHSNLYFFCSDDDRRALFEALYSPQKSATWGILKLRIFCRSKGPTKNHKRALNTFYFFFTTDFRVLLHLSMLVCALAKEATWSHLNYKSLGCSLVLTRRFLYALQIKSSGCSLVLTRRFLHALRIKSCASSGALCSLSVWGEGDGGWCAVVWCMCVCP